MHDWVQHFGSRVESPLAYFYNGEGDISHEEKTRIAYSIAQFERGESSEAKDFLGKCQRFEAKTELRGFHDETIVFVAEENFHSKLLRTFMESHGIPRRDHSWTDLIFRVIRHAGNLAWTSRVLATAEIFAQVYYPALRVATANPVLARICDRIIEDEDYHIEFQAEHIALAEASYGIFRRTFMACAHWVLFVGTLAVVALDHRSVLFHTLTLRTYLVESVQRFRCLLNQISVYGKSRAWLPAQEASAG